MFENNFCEREPLKIRFYSELEESFFLHEATAPMPRFILAKKPISSPPPPHPLNVPYIVMYSMLYDNSLTSFLHTVEHLTSINNRMS